MSRVLLDRDRTPTNTGLPSEEEVIQGLLVWTRLLWNATTKGTQNQERTEEEARERLDQEHIYCQQI